jgi:hypothetical protein
MRVSRITEEKYEKLLAMYGALQVDALTFQDDHAKKLVSGFASVLIDILSTHKLEEPKEPQQP